MAPPAPVAACIELIKARPDTRAVLLGGHGVLAFGTDTETTVSLLVALEEAAAEAELRTAVLGRLSAPPGTLHIWGMAAGERCAKKLLKVFPCAGQMARENRQFQRRAVRYVASHGVTQFIDLGCGLPTNPNTHEAVQEIQPNARTVYVDNDELVLSHAQNILAKSKDVLPVHPACGRTFSGAAWPVF